MSSDSVTIFNVGFSSKVDGPGQRMVIYFKGCNLNCPWCAAPESLSSEPEVMFYADRVDGIAEAIAVCPHRAIKKAEGGLSRNIAKCKSCRTHECIASHHPAFELVGGATTLHDLIEKAERYRPFFGEHGGVTIGGGEPTCQFDALHDLLIGLKEKGIHTAIETNGTHPRLSALFGLIDLLYIDLKHPDPDWYSGPGAEHVQDNIASRYRHGGAVVVRLPFISGYNADLATVHAFGELLSTIGPLTVELLPYHTRAEAKWRACSLPAPSGTFQTPSTRELNEAAETLRGYGLTIR